MALIAAINSGQDALLFFFYTVNAQLFSFRDLTAFK